MYRAGWPKADILFTDEFDILTRAKAKEYGVQSGQTVLYAPTLESDNKVIEFIEYSEGIFDNTLIKLPPYDDTDLSETIDRQHGGRTILPKTSNILEALTLADVVVSDQSSVLIEAVLTDTIPVSVIDWPIRWGDSPSYPGKTLPPFTLRTTRNELTGVLRSINRDYDLYADKLDKERKRNFDNLGSSASAVMDIIDDCIKPSTPSPEPIKIKPTRWRPDKNIIKRWILHQLTQLKSSE